MKSLHAADLFRNWKQLDPLDAYRQIFFKSQINHYLKNKIYSEYGAMLRALFRCASHPKHHKTLKELTAEQIVDIFHDTEMPFHKPFFHFYIPKIGVKATVLHAPEEDMATTSYMQFYYTDAAFSAYLISEQNGNKKEAEEAFHKFVATLYKPKDTAFDEQLVEKYIAGMKLADFEKILIATAYANIRQKVMDRYVYLFPYEPDKEADKETEITYTGKMWQDLHHSLAETPAFMGFDKSANSRMWQVLDYLNHKAEQNHKQKERNGL